MSDDYNVTWTDRDERALDRLREDAKRSVRPSKVKITQGRPSPPPPWARPVLDERAEEHAVLQVYERSPPEVRAWLQEHVDARLASRKVPELWRDRILRDVLLEWKAGELEGSDAA